MKRWWCIETQPGPGPAIFIGRVEATEKEIRDALGPYLTVEASGSVLVWGRPNPNAVFSR